MRRIMTVPQADWQPGLPTFAMIIFWRTDRSSMSMPAVLIGSSENATERDHTIMDSALISHDVLGAKTQRRARATCVNGSSMMR